MKVAIITAGVLPVPPTKGGAVENLVYTFINENEKAKHPIDIDLYSIDFENNNIYSTNQIYCNYIFQKFEGRVGNLQLRIINNKIIKKLMNKFEYSPYLNFICRSLRRKKYDYIIIENRPQYVLPIKKINKSKILLHMHNDHMIDNKKKNIKVADSCERIIVVSDYIKNQLIDNLGIDKNKVITLHNGIDSVKFNKENFINTNEKLKLNLGIESNDFILLFTGRLIREKGILEVISAVKKLKNEINFKLIVVGSSWYGSNIKSDFMKELEEISRDIENKIIFTGYIDYSEVPQIYSLANIIILPSMWDDPFPLVVLEAMSMGIPVITTISGGIPEMFTGKEGILLTRNNRLSDNISEEIKVLYNDREKCTLLGNNARKRVVSNFTNEKYYNNFIELLGRV